MKRLLGKRLSGLRSAVLIAALVFAAAPAGGALAADHKDAPPPAGFATLSVTKTYKSALTVAGSQTFMVYDTPACDKPHKAMTLFMSSAKTQPTLGGKRIVIVAALMVTSTRSVGMINGSPAANLGQDSCMASASFVPEAGHRYEVVQAGSLTRCDVTVTDAATGVPPPGLKTQPALQCGSYFADDAPPA